MKKLTIFSLLIGGAILLLPPVFGMLAHDRIEQSLAHAAAQSDNNVELRLEDYQKGWFSSTGKLVAQIKSANPDLAGLQGQKFSQNFDINHGPIIFGQQIGFGLAEALSVFDGTDNAALTALLEKTGNPYFLRTSMLFGFTGQGDVVLDAPAFTADNPSDGFDNMVFAGANASGTFNLSDMHTVLTGKMEGLSLTGAGSEMVIEQINFSTDIAYPESHPYGLGSGEITLDRVVGIGQDQTSVDAQQVKISYESTEQENSQSAFSMTYATDRLVSLGNTFEDIKVTFAMGNLSQGAMGDFQKFSNNIAADPTNTEFIMAELLDPTYELLSGGVNMSLAPIQYTYNNRLFNADLLLTSKPENLPPKTAFSFENPLLFLNLFRVNANLTVDRSLAAELMLPQIKQQLLAGAPADAEIDEATLENMAQAQTPMMLAALVGQGMLTEDGNNYKVAASYDNGALLVNENPIPLGALLQN